MSFHQVTEVRSKETDIISNPIQPDNNFVNVFYGSGASAVRENWPMARSSNLNNYKVLSTLLPVLNLTITTQPGVIHRSLIRQNVSKPVASNRVWLHKTASRGDV